jgi:lysophospholipase L1-like esterase
VRSDRTFARWNLTIASQRYPNIINADENLGAQPTRKFQYLGCSGATASNVLADQVPLLKSPQMVTLSVGGNDAEFATVLNYCVYQWMVVFWYSCDSALRDARDKINSAAYTTDLTNLISAIKGKMKHPSNRIYWVGYGKYFGEPGKRDRITISIAYILQTPQLLSATK